MSSYASVPSGSKAIGDSSFLAPNGDIYHGNTVVATGASSAYWTYNRFAGGTSGYSIVTYVKGTTGYRRDNDGTVTTYTVSSNSTAIGDRIFLAPNGDVHQWDTKVLSGTDSAYWYFNQANRGTASQNVYTYAVEPTCP